MKRDPRYARHWIVPEIGDAGQEKLQALRVPDPELPCERIASDYLLRSGAKVSGAIPDFEGWPTVELGIASDPTAAADEVVDGAFIALEILRRTIGLKASAVINVREGQS